MEGWFRIYEDTGLLFARGTIWPPNWPGRTGLRMPRRRAFSTQLMTVRRDTRKRVDSSSA